MKEILHYLDAQAPEEISAVAISEGGNIKRSSVYSGLDTLVHAGFVTRQWEIADDVMPERVYRLTPNGVLLVNKLGTNNGVVDASIWRELLGGAS